MAKNGDGVTVLTRADGNMITAVSIANVEQGEKVKCMVRPECVRLLADGEHADNVATGVLKEAIMSGHVTRYFVELADGTPMVSPQLTRGPIADVATGGAVRLGWPTDRTVALKT